LNRLTSAGVLVEDKLFSTLDPTTRRLELPDGRPCVVTDTVGFVRKLPHTLVEAFKSTLEEAVLADLIIHLVDGSDRDPEGQYVAVREVLGEIGAATVRELVAVNKIDSLSEVAVARWRRRFPEAAFLSALQGEGVPELLQRVSEELPHPEIEVDLLVPYDRGDVVAALHAAGAVVSEEYLDDGTRLRARLREDQLSRMERYLLPSESERAGRTNR
jgi:GTP-binding protein HflX